ncbi:phosphate ABC transporter substrate-binding protein PstS [Halochromatium sp.]
MKRSANPLLTHLSVVLLSVCLLLPPALIAGEKPLRIYGSGATFPAPLFSSWMHSFTAEHPKIQPDYQGTSSAGGLKDLAEGRVDFAAADFRIADEQAAELGGGILQVPMAAAGVVLVYNLPDVGQLWLSREALIGLFSGEISRWDDPLIAKTNPNASLPDLPITLVARTGASGTSYNLTTHLSTISSDLAQQIGATLTPAWNQVIERPGGLIRGAGNDGVISLVRSIPGAIGYVAYPYADFTNTPMAAIENKDGKLVAPSPVSFAASMDAIRQSPSIETLIDPAGESAYPLIAVSYVMLRKDYDHPQKRQAILDIVDYALGPGQQIAERIGYIPFSPAAIEYVRRQLEPLKQPPSEAAEPSSGERQPVNTNQTDAQSNSHPEI